MIHRGYRFRLYPTAEQEIVLRQYADATRFVFNIALEQRRDWWRQFKATTGRTISLVSQSRELTQMRRENDWLKAAPRGTLEYALYDVERAFATFFRHGGFPAFRAKERYVGFRCRGNESRWHRVNRKWAMVRIPKAGDMKFRCTRDAVGTLQSVSVQCVAGAWYVSLNTAAEPKLGARREGAVGVDRGVANTIAMSDGNLRSLPGSIAGTIAARRRAQHVLSRRKIGSKRRIAQRSVVAKLHARAADARKHWLHEQSTGIANGFASVAMEALCTRAMTRAGAGKRGLNRSILEQGWAAFAEMLDYKVAARGGQVYYVNPAYTSQTCSSCGSVDARSRKSQADFECVDCGHRAHADVNAAINILRRSPACVEVPGHGAVETRPGEAFTRLENLAA